MRLQKIIFLIEIFSLASFQIISFFLTIFSQDISNMTNHRIMNAEAPLSYIIAFIIVCILVNIYSIRNKEYFLNCLKNYILYFSLHWIILFVTTKLFKLPDNTFNGSYVLIFIIPLLFCIYLYKKYKKISK